MRFGTSRVFTSSKPNSMTAVPSRWRRWLPVAGEGAWEADGQKARNAGARDPCINQEHRARETPAHNVNLIDD
ncbi:unnamed protein product, partial [Brenthis ino]